MWATVSDRIRAKRGQGRHETAVLENVCQRHGSTRHQPRDRDRSHHDERSRLNNQENCCRSATTQSRSPKWGNKGELETFVGKKQNKLWIWTAVDRFAPGILAWVVGDHSAATFRPLWDAISIWQCYFWVSDGNPVYPGFIPAGDQILSKTYRTYLTSFMVMK